MKKSLLGGARWSAAVLLLAAPLAAYPLVFGGTLAGRNFSFVQMVTPEVIGVFALGVAIAFPEKIIALLRERNFFARLFLALALLFLFWSLIRWFAGDTCQKFATALFYTALPLACVAVGDELKKLLPGALILYGALGVIYGLISPHGEGFLLNWNWNSTLVKLGIAALAMRLFPRRRKGFLIALTVLFAVDLAIERHWRGTYFSTGSWVALAMATVFLTLLHRLPGKRRGMSIFAAALFSAAVVFALPHLWPQSRASRIQLWRGTQELFTQHFLTGVGAGNFEDKIQETLPADYYFARFLAPRHNHPHNETLFFLAVFGIAGGFFLAALLAAAMETPDENETTRLLRWGMLLLFFHGCVDVLLGEALPGTLFYALAGALLAPKTSSSDRFRLPRLAVFALTVIAASFFAGRILLGSIAYRQAAMRFRQKLSCRDQIACALAHRSDARALYLAGMEALRAGDFAAAEKSFENLHRDLHLDGFLHSNRFAGIAAMGEGDFAAAATYFAREERRYPFSVTNAYTMAYLAKKMAAPREFQRSAEQKVLDLLALRGKTANDLGDFLFGNADDTVPCVRKEK